MFGNTPIKDTIYENRRECRTERLRSFKLFRAQNAHFNYLLVFDWHNRKIQDTQLG